MSLFRPSRTVRGGESRVQATAWGEWAGDQSPSWSGARVSTSSAMQLMAVYGSVRLIADQISTLPVDVFRSLPDGSTQPVATPGWLEFPYEGLHRTAWLTQVLSSLLLAGNAFIAQLATETSGFQLLVLDPDKVKIVRDAQQRKQVLVSGQPASVPIVHIPGLMMPGSDVGLSPIEAARQTIGVGLAAAEFGARFFSQAAIPSGVIEVPGRMDPDNAKALAKAWTRAHSGTSKSHLPGVLEGGATWKQTQISPEQAQFLQTRQFTAAEIIGSMFLLDPSDLGTEVYGTKSSLTYANLEQRDTRRLKVALLPWIVRIEAALSDLLARPRFMKFNVNALLRGDTLTRYQAYQIGITSGFLVPNEAREKEDLPPLEAAPTPVGADVPPT